MFVDDLMQANEKKETQLKWMFELFTSFLMGNAPLKLKINEINCKKLEDMFERSPLDNINQMKKIFDEIKQEAVEQVNFQLNRFQEVKQIGNYYSKKFSVIFNFYEINKIEFSVKRLLITLITYNIKRKN